MQGGLAHGVDVTKHQQNITKHWATQRVEAYKKLEYVQQRHHMKLEDSLMLIFENACTGIKVGEVYDVF